MTNFTEQQQNEIKMFGMTEQLLNTMIQSRAKHTSPLITAAGMCSDIQEQIEYANGIATKERERMRQALNRVKFVIFEYLDTIETRV